MISFHIRIGAFKFVLIRFDVPFFRGEISLSEEEALHLKRMLEKVEWSEHELRFENLRQTKILRWGEKWRGEIPFGAWSELRSIITAQAAETPIIEGEVRK